MDWTLEVVQVPVSDVDRAKRFYAEQLRFAVDRHTVAALAPAAGSVTTIAAASAVKSMR